MKNVNILFYKNKVLYRFLSTAYGSRDGKISIGMCKEEAERYLGEPVEEEASTENNVYVNAIYQRGNSIFEIGYEHVRILHIYEEKFEQIASNI
ncbi:hypothetical protein [Kineothrix sp. MB12-C1]|uniref:hypothetical protein n=1 Tax=Kineothrix sp. MB12-C1 TaxID=3070215 RepID=UPI0027D2C1EE|nr:hypothetical protein [Kineothrix sp. MB12-C1]WMC92185.1 hypothetical protein RBB56_15220 [Kineothrix sp. MB12-C1]